MNSKQPKKTFENALFHALKSHGLMPPSIEEQEAGTTESALPTELSNPETFIKKEAKVVSLKSKPKRSVKKTQYAKVAMKGTKGKKR